MHGRPQAYFLVLCTEDKQPLTLLLLKYLLCAQTLRYGSKTTSTSLPDFHKNNAVDIKYPLHFLRNGPSENGQPVKENCNIQWVFVRCEHRKRSLSGYIYLVICCVQSFNRTDVSGTYLTCLYFNAFLILGIYFDAVNKQV